MRRRALTVLARLPLLAIIAGAASTALAAQPDDPAALRVAWRQQATVRMPGVTRVVVLDETICQAEVAGDVVRVSGVTVGDTVIFAWVDGVRTARVVQVTQPPDKPRAATISRSAREAIGQGRVGSSVMTNGSAESAPVVTHEYWDWQQKRNGARLSVRGLSDTYTDGVHAFNLGSLSVQHETANRTWSVMDFTLNTAGADIQVSPLAQYGGLQLRGIDFVNRRGRDRLELFGGTTVPPFFLTFGGTRSIVGARVDRAASPRLALFTTAGAVSAPATIGDTRRSTTAFGVSGFAYRPSPGFSLRATGGVSTRGLMGDLQVDFSRGRFAASVAATDSAAGFALNQVQLLTSPEAAVRGVATLGWSRVSLTTSARHAVSKRNVLTGLEGASDTLSQSVQLTLPHRQQVSGSVTRDAGRTSLLGETINTRAHGAWSSTLGSRFANTLQLGVGTNREATELNSYREWSIRDAATVSLPFGSFDVSFERQQLDPSRPARIRQVIDQLPPSLQDLFRLDPVLFLETVDVPGDVRQLLSRVQPTSTAFSVGARYSRGTFAINPTFSVMSDTFGAGSSSRSYVLGYSATWQIARTWQVRSSLSSRILYFGSAAGFRRANVFTVGFDKSFTGLPRWFGAAAPSYAIEGHVFRDTTVDGIFTATKPGLPGVRIRLDDGRVATTDNTGYFRFGKVQPGLRHLSLDLTRFGQPVRMTTPSEVDVEVVDGGVQVNFGMVNFARIVGTVFNDYLNDGRRQGDAPGLAGITVRVRAGSFSAAAVSDGSGDYDIADVPPGDYTVSIESDDLPADHVLVRPEEHVHVDALATAVADVPVRALRSISGRVLSKTPHGNGEIVEPLEGVTITAGTASAKTDSEGRFILRDLPAGLVQIRVIPAREVPGSVRVPSGTVRLGTGPTRIENANIVITNPALIDYIAPVQTASQPVSRGRR